MANIKNFTTGNQYIDGYIEAWETDVNITNNTSKAHAAVYMHRNNSWEGNSYTSHFYRKLTINGSTVYETTSGATIPPKANGYVKVAEGEVDVTHNADGKKTVTITFVGEDRYATNTSGFDISLQSGTLTLSNIPRQATLLSAPNFNDEQNPTITYSNPAGNAVTSLQACISWTDKDDIAYRDISKTGSSYTFNFTNVEREKLRQATATSNTLSVKFYVRTTIGSNTFYSTLNKTLTIINAKPTLYPIIEDTNSVTKNLTGNASKMVKYFSNPEVATGAAAYKSATITQHAITNGSKKTTQANDIFNKIDNHIFAFWAKDSRGNEVYQEINKINEGNWIDYVKITCNVSHTNPTTDGKMTLNVKGNYWNGNFGVVANELTLQYRKGVVGQSFGSWTTVTANISGNTYNASISFEGLDYQTTYKFEVRALDKLETTPTKYIEVQTTPMFDWGKNDFRFNVDTYGFFSHKVKALPEGSGDADYWRNLVAGHYWYNGDANNVGGMPNKWGLLIKTTYNTEFNVIYYTQPEGAIFRRSGNSNNDSGWYAISNSKILYNNTGGNAGTVTLNENISNFRDIEIIYTENHLEGGASAKIMPNGKIIHLGMMRATSNTRTLFKRTTYTLSETTITPDMTKSAYSAIDGSTVTTTDATTSNQIYITRVIGYR